MSDFPFRIVGFDLDGTFLDTSGDLTAAVNHALTSIGRPTLSVAEVKPMIGGGAKALLSRGLAESGGYDEAMLTMLHRRLLDYYAGHIAVHTAPYPGALAALDVLAAKGVRLAIVTNKLERLATDLLERLDYAARFDCIIGGDTLPRAKPDRMPVDAMIARCGGGSAAFVGDSKFDVGAARNAGIPSIACSFGFLQQPVDTLGADAVIDHYDELLPTLERLTPVA